MKRSVLLFAATAVCCAGGAARAEEEPRRADGSIRYSRFLLVGDGVGSIGGWQVSGARPFGKDLALALDVGGYHAEGDSVFAAMVGPRLGGDGRGRAAFFCQFLAGLALAPGSGGAFVAHPGVGADIGRVRLQLDWPVITQYGVAWGAARVSGGVRFGGSRKPGRP